MDISKWQQYVYFPSVLRLTESSLLIMVERSSEATRALTRSTPSIRCYVTHSCAEKQQLSFSSSPCFYLTSISSDILYGEGKHFFHSSTLALRDRKMSIVQRVFQKLKRLNLFVDTDTASTDDEQIRRNQVLATRVYLILMISSFSTLIIFTCLRTRDILVTGPNPSVDTYDRLYTVYSQVLSCPCEQISVPYSSFLSVATVQHPVRVHHFTSADRVSTLPFL